MRLTFLLSSLHVSGGVQTVVAFAARLAARGHCISVVLPRGAIDPRVREGLGTDVNVIEAGAGLADGMSHAAMASLALAMARAVPAGDVVVATHAPTAVPALLAAHRFGQRAVWFYQDYMEMFVSRPIERAIVRLLHPRFEQVLTVSEAAAADARARGARRTTNLRTGIADAELFHPPVNGDARVPGLVMCLTDMRPRKGLAEFLAAAEIVAAREPRLRLAVVSKDPCSVRTNVPYEFHQRPPRAALADLFRRCAVYVSPTWSESLGLPALEAMACGAPVVTTRTLGAAEYAREGANCLVVPPRDPRALADAVTRVLGDPALAGRLSAAAAATAAGFRWDDCVDRFEAAVCAREDDGRVAAVAARGGGA